MSLCAMWEAGALGHVYGVATARETVCPCVTAGLPGPMPQRRCVSGDPRAPFNNSAPPEGAGEAPPPDPPPTGGGGEGVPPPPAPPPPPHLQRLGPIFFRAFSRSTMLPRTLDPQTHGTRTAPAKTVTAPDPPPGGS